jgi:DNA-binding transcriptional MerR regulator
MPIVVNGVPHKTIQEAAAELGTTDKTLRDWIDRGIVPEPPKTPNGTMYRRYFPDKLIEDYKHRIAAIREERQQNRKKLKDELQRTRKEK